MLKYSYNSAVEMPVLVNHVNNSNSDVLEASQKMSATMSVAELASCHPVVSILFGRGNEPGSYDSRSLQEFIDYEFNHGSHHNIPYTMTDFYTDYINFAIIRYLSKNRAKYGPRHFRFNIRDILNRLAKLAYLNTVRHVRITEAMVLKVLPPLDNEKDEKFEDGKYPEPDLEFRSFGILEKEEDTKKNMVFFVFHELCVRDYLVAQFLSNECQRKVNSGKEGIYIVSSTMRECMRRLPETGDIWRMAFGLMADNQKTKDGQQDILTELIEEAKLLKTLSPFDITNICVESIYESQNAGILTDLLDEFTLNQTIRYSNQFLATDRMLYAVSAVGYIVRASGNVYGVHMSQFGLGAKNIAMLADPVNDVSDNNLQVLNLSYNPLGASGMKGLLRFLVKATLLSHLDLTCCELGNVGIALLGEFFMCMPLRYLRLSENNVSDPGVRRLVKNFKYISTLEWLDLSENEITDKGAIKIGESLPLLPNLRSLDLRRNKIGDDGCDAISTNLDQLNQVTELMLSDNRIGERGANKLSAHVWKTKSLRLVNLTLNNIPAEGIMGLRKAVKDHGDLHVTVSQETNDTTILSEGEFLITPEDPAPISPRRVGSNTSTMTSASHASVNLLTGRDADFDAERRPLRRSWSGRGSFRRSWHGKTGIKRNDAI